MAQGEPLVWAVSFNCRIGLRARRFRANRESVVTDRRTVDGTVTTEADGPSRVAYDLMNRIFRHEDGKGATFDREYFLRLYAQCSMVVNNPYKLDSALELTKK